MHHVQGRKRSIKCSYREKGCKVGVVRMHIDCLFPTGDKNDWRWKHTLLNTVHISFYLLKLEFPFIMTEIVGPILDNYENGIIRMSLHTSHFLPKEATSCSRLLINFKYNNYIQDKKPIWTERKTDVMGTQ